MPASQKKGGRARLREKVFPQPVNDTPKIDWEKVDSTEISQATKDFWYNSACEAIRKGSLDAFKTVLKSVLPISGLVSLFQQHTHDVADIDIIKIAIIRGLKPIVACMLVVLGEVKFYEFAQWKLYSAVHVAAMWGHVELVERMYPIQSINQSIGGLFYR